MFPKTRVEAFSDGVFAIAITLLVIEIRPPELAPGGTLASALAHRWPSYVAYVISFLVIGVMWLNHHRIFGQVRGVDGPLLLLNLNLLLWVAVIPFPTAVLAAHLRDGGEPARTAMALYGAILFVTAVAFTALFAWVTHDNRLLGAALPRVELLRARVRFGLGLGFYAVAFALAFLSAPAALVLHAAMALYYAFDQASVAEPETVEERARTAVAAVGDARSGVAAPSPRPERSRPNGHHMDALLLLTADHNRVRGLFSRFKTAHEAQDTTTMATLGETILRELDVHTEIEEEVFYPAIRQASEELEEGVAEGIEEHHVVKVLASEIRALSVEDETWSAKMTVLIENVEHHAGEEESEIFPDAATALGEADLAELGDRLEAKKAELGAPTLADKEGLGTDQLRKLASEQEIPGRSSMDREELRATVAPS